MNYVVPGPSGLVYTESRPFFMAYSVYFDLQFSPSAINWQMANITANEAKHSKQN